MKKRSWGKRAGCLGLIFSLAAGLCACGGGGKNANSALAKENVYRIQEITLPEIDGDDFNIYTTAHRDGTAYIMIEVYHWNDEKYSANRQSDIRIMSIKDDGSDVQLVRLDMPETESLSDQDMTGGTGSGGGPAVQPRTETQSSEEPEADPEGEEGSEADPDGEGEPAGNSQSPDEPEADPDGEGEPAGNSQSPEEPEADPEGEEGSEADPDGEEGSEADPEGEQDAMADSMIADPGYMPNDVWENSYYNSFIFGADGKVYALKSYSYNNYSTETYIEKNYIVSWNPDGSFQWERELGELRTEEEYVYVNAMTAAEDGTVTLILAGDNAYTLVVDAQGNVGDKKPMSEETAKVFNNFDRVIDRGDGTFLAVYYDENDWTKQFIATYDPATDTLGQSTPLPASFVNGGYGNMSIGLNQNLICSNGDGIYTFKIGDENLTQKMNFVNSDLFVSNFSSIVELSDTSFLGVYNENYEGGMKAGLFTYVDPKDIQDKSVLVLAGTYIGNDLEKRVIDFNRSNEEYRIVVKSYDSYNTYDDWQAGYTQLNNDVTTGNMPDILITDGLPVENYVAKGLLEDIGKMIEEDEELSQTEFVQNVFDAYSVDGKLYYIIPSFTVSTMIGKREIVGDRTSWTMADMLELQAGLPEGTNMIGELTRQGFFSTMMQFCGRDFVDVDTGKCEFDSPNFISMMEFAKSLPEELSEEYFGEEYWATYESQYREGRTVLCQTSSGNIRDLNYTVNGSFGGDVTYIGFPTESGCGSYISANECYAISSKSRNKEGAWEFMRYYLTEEYQSELTWGMPTQKKYFDEMAQNATQRPFYLNENGSKEEYDDYFWMNGEQIKLDPLSQEQVDEIVNLICSIDKCYYYNENVMNIINEEMDAFYTDQKSAQEVAKTIQNRVQLYVNENR